jgi:CRP-like cAMP-binding protein
LAKVASFPPGRKLFGEGTPGDYLYFLTSGSVDLFYHLGEGGPVKVDRVTAEEFVDCSVLIPPYKYTATAQSVTEITLLEIDARVLRHLMKEDCQLGFAIQQHILQILMDQVIWFRLSA